MQERKPVATIVCGTRTYDVTHADKLWLLRAVQCEGRVERQVAQTLVNLFALLYSRKAAPSLTELVRSYAQPVNPEWFPEGKMFLRWHAINPSVYKLADATRREKLHSTRLVFRSDVMEAVDRALALGPKDIQSNCTDYAASWIDASKKYAALTPPERGVNRLWTRDASWTGYSIQPLPLPLPSPSP